MKIPVWLSTVLLTTYIALQGWEISMLIAQGNDIAAIKATLNLRDTAQK